MPASFTHRSTRSTPLLLVLGALVVLETAGVHVLLIRRLPLLAAASTALGVLAILWLAADHAALGRVPTTVSEDTLALRVGRRARADIPRDAVASAVAPTWKDLPALPEPGYLNATKPAEPNVLLTFAQPVPVRLPGGLVRPVRRLALRVDEPGAFLSALAR